MGLFLESFCLELFLCFLTSLVVLYLWVRERYRYFEKLGLPYIKPSLSFPNYARIWTGRERFSEPILLSYDLLHDHRMGGYFQILQPIFVLRDPELVNTVFIKDFGNYMDRPIAIDEKTNPLDGHLFNLSGDKWRLMRKKLTPTFTSGRLKWMFHQMAVCGDGLLQIIKDEGKRSGNETFEIEVRDLMARYTTDVIGSCAFGLEPTAIKDPNCSFREMGKKIFNPTLKQIFFFAFRFAFPEFFLKLKLKTVDPEMEEFFRSLVSQSFSHRMSTGESRNDFIQLLLQLKLKGKLDYDPKDKEEQMEDLEGIGSLETPEMTLEFTDGLLTAQAFVFFAAGFETSATTMGFTLYLLSNGQNEQDKARKEIKEMKEKHGGKFTYDSIRDMVYLDACIKESMRVLPPIDALSRVTNKDVVLDGVKIKKGTLLVIPVASIHKDPKYFPEPQQYKPERFLGQQEILPGSYLPFGDGPRICIARRFALLEAKLGLALILDEYKITKSPNLKEPLVFNPRAFINQPLGGICLNFTRLND